MANDATFATTPPRTRRWRRFEFTVPIRVTVDKFRQASVISSRGSRVNAGGLVFFADTDLAIGDETEIAFPDYNDLTLRGVVRNRAGHNCGVKFLAASAEEAENLGLFRQILSSRMGCLEA
jgi:hypothetical protein